MDRSNFELKKVKFLNGVLHANYKSVKANGGESYEENCEMQSTLFPHSDLTNQLDKLKPLMAQCMGFTTLTTVLKSLKTKKQQDAYETLEEVINKDIKLKVDNFTCTGIAISGRDESINVILTGTYKNPAGTVTSQNTPKMRLSSEVYGFEEELEKIVEILEDETYQFLFEQKQAQAVLDFNGNAEA